MKCELGGIICHVEILPEHNFRPLWPAERSFAEALREITEQEGILLIFDSISVEVTLCWKLPADLRALGKIIGGGFPVDAYGGRKDIMDKVVSPPGFADTREMAKQKIFSSGTFSGNPVSMIAGLATIRELEKPSFHERIDGYGERIRSGLQEICDNAEFDSHISESLDKDVDGEILRIITEHAKNMTCGICPCHSCKNIPW